MNWNPQRPSPKWQLRLRRVLLACVALYVIAGIGCASFQRKLIYHPPVFNSAQVDEFARRTKLERWTNSTGDAVGMKRPSLHQPSSGQVLIVYGNGNCTTGCAHYVDVIQQAADFDVFILEYPGYADRAGFPSQSNWFHAADEALRLFETNRPIYLVGESLGTGVASYLAGMYPEKVTGIVLFAPYNRLADVAQYYLPIFPVKWMLVDRFPSEQYLRNYHGPVGILVAGKDWVVPQRFGRRLYAGYAGPKHLWEFPSDNHWTVTERSADFWKQVVEFWQSPQ